MAQRAWQKLRCEIIYGFPPHLAPLEVVYIQCKGNTLLGEPAQADTRPVPTSYMIAVRSSLQPWINDLCC